MRLAIERKPLPVIRPLALISPPKYVRAPGHLEPGSLGGRYENRYPSSLARVSLKPHRRTQFVSSRNPLGIIRNLRSSYSPNNFDDFHDFES